MSRIGSRIPTTVVHTLGSDGLLKLKFSTDYFKNRKVIYFSLPGAFTPTCTNSQLPEFELKYNKFKEFGIDGIVCGSVNDAYVMKSWFEHLNIKNVEYFPDGNLAFTHHMGMIAGKQHLGFGDRSWRYAMIVEDGVIKAWFEEPGFNMTGSDIDPYQETTAENVLGLLKYLKENEQPDVSDD